MVGGELGFQPVMAHFHPLDMTEVTDFRKIQQKNVRGHEHGAKIGSNLAIPGLGEKNYRFWGFPPGSQLELARVRKRGASFQEDGPDGRLDCGLKAEIGEGFR